VNALDEAVHEMRRASPDERRLRWVAPASYHVTLKFLGWTRPEVGFALRDAIGAALAGQRAFEMETRGLGAFPGPERARVLWAGVDPGGAARLSALAERVERAAEALGFAREQRPYHPHVTLARLAGPTDIRGVVSRYTEQLFRSSWVDGVVLFETKTRSGGSEYHEKARWPLETDSKPSRRHTGPVDHEDPVDDPVLDELPGNPPDGPAGDAERPNDDREE
jgi:2'-5' RNA ligase